MKAWAAFPQLLDRIVAAGWVLEHYERRVVFWLRSRLGIVVKN